MLGIRIPIPTRPFRAELSVKMAGPDKFFAAKIASAREGVTLVALASHGA